MNTFKYIEYMPRIDEMITIPSITRLRSKRERKDMAHDSITETFLGMVRLYWDELKGKQIGFKQGGYEYALYYSDHSHLYCIRNCSRFSSCIENVVEAHTYLRRVFNPCTLLRVMKLIEKTRMDNHARSIQKKKEEFRKDLGNRYNAARSQKQKQAILQNALYNWKELSLRNVDGVKVCW